MSATPGVVDTLSRAGVSLVLHLKDREQPVYCDVAVPLRPNGTFDVEVWGVVGDLTISISNVKSATTPEVGFCEYRAIRSRQKAAFGREHGTAPRSPEDDERKATRPLLPPTPRGGCDE